MEIVISYSFCVILHSTILSTIALCCQTATIYKLTLLNIVIYIDVKCNESQIIRSS